jgi:phosphatidylserine/phosphatidylglycerophosphate/cardiolipin synthase-like enzyme
LVERDVQRSHRSLRIEQQYIRGGQPAVEELLTEIRVARDQNPGLSIQIIVSPKYLFGEQKQKFVRSMENSGFAFDDNYRYLSADHFVHCHNKLIVVDEEKVLLGSQNWSTSGLLSNRETSLLVENAGVASYFADLFDTDWRLSEPTGAPPDVLGFAPDSVRPAADFAKGGVVISSIRDYSDV